MARHARALRAPLLSPAALLLVLVPLSMAAAPAELPAQAQTPPADVAKAIGDFLQDSIDAGRLVGVTVAVMQGDRVLTARGYGLADVENAVPVHSETVMKIGSVTKQYASALLMQLVEEGRIALDDPVTDYVDGPAAWEGITVHHLLNHTSGIRSYTGMSDFWTHGQALDLTDQELMDAVRAEPLDFPVGTDYRYSNSGYYLVGMIIGEVTGMPFRVALDRRLLRPLGLRYTSYCDDEPIVQNRAQGYDIGGDDIRNTTHISMETPGAAGAMCSTPLDLIRWARALHGGKVVSEDSFRTMTTPVPPAGEPGDGYGYGLSVGALQGHRSVGHSGGINGFSAFLAHYPDDDLTVALIVNGGGPASRYARRVAAMALGLDVGATDR